MSFSDPAVLTVNAVAKNLVRVNQDGYSSEYRLREATGEYILTIRNTSFKNKDGRNIARHQMKFVHRLNPVAPATTPTLRTAFVTFEADELDTLVDPVYIAKALVGFSSDANLNKLMNSES